MSHVMRKPVFAICEQQRHRSPCASAQSDQRLYYSLPGKYNTSSFHIHNFKPLANLCSWAMPWENVSPGVSNQPRHKPACAGTEASWSLEISPIESSDIILSQQRATKALIRSAPLLFAYDIRHIFSWPNSYIMWVNSESFGETETGWMRRLGLCPSLRRWPVW